MITRKQLIEIDAVLESVELFYADCNERGNVKPTRDDEINLYAVIQTVKNELDNGDDD